jgi:hypothetical protein
MATAVSFSRSITALSAQNKSTPLSSNEMPKAEHRLPGPRASPKLWTALPLRDWATSIPSWTEAARNKTAAAVPSGPHETFAHTWIP